MLNGRNLVVDTFSLVYKQLLPWRTHEFWDFESHDPVPNSVYVIGRKQFVEHRDKVLALTDDHRYLVFFDNAAEGSWTLTSQLEVLKLDDLCRQGRILVIGGSEMPADYACLSFEHFLTCILDYETNVDAMRHTSAIFSKTHKPYGFLFLNGRSRPHRKYLFERLRTSGLLDRSLWTMLDGRPCVDRSFRLDDGDLNVMATPSPIRSLPSQYEYDAFKDATVLIEPRQRRFIKHDLFDHTWGEIYLKPEPYIDTYFSLVTETIYQDAHSFRTEKIAKPLAMGHPWICAANPGFYRDLRDLGFQTFQGLIDESFDTVLDHQARMDRIIAEIDYVLREPVAFLQAAESVCKYNQQHLIDLGSRLRSQFPQRFFDFIQQHG